jgi:hypothetical protein
VNHRLAATCLAFLFSVPALAQEQPTITFVNSIKLETINNDGVLDLTPLGAAPGDWIYVVGVARLTGSSMDITGGPDGEWRLVSTHERWHAEEQATVGMRAWLLGSATGNEGAKRFFTFTGAIIHSAVVFHAYAFRQTPAGPPRGEVKDEFNTNDAFGIIVAEPIDPLPSVVINTVSVFDEQDLTHDFGSSEGGAAMVTARQGRVKTSSAYKIYPVGGSVENILASISTPEHGPKAMVATVLRPR